MFIETTSDTEASGKLRDIYEGDRKTYGYVPNHAKVFSLRPDVLEAWRAMQLSIRKNLTLRRYELVTIAAADTLNCRYCLLAHGSVLMKNGFGVEQLRAILSDYHNAGLDPVEVAIMDFARKATLSASEMTQADTDALRAFGLKDIEILDITLAATMRSFASKTFDALGADPDPVYAKLEEELADLLPA